MHMTGKKLVVSDQGASDIESAGDTMRRSESVPLLKSSPINRYGRKTTPFRTLNKY